MSAAAPRFELLDLPVALDRVGGDPELLREIVGIFVDECPRLMEHIDTAIVERNGKALERAAHSLKGAVANFTSNGIIDTARGLEALGRANLVDSAQPLLKQLAGELEQLVNELNAAVRL